jgi:inositol phosphorylceramide mannosyltransferase catalytic subunit
MKKYIRNYLYNKRDSLNIPKDSSYVKTRDFGKSIPKTIIQIYHDIDSLAIELKENIEHLKTLNPDWEHLFFDDIKMDAYVEKNYPEILHIYRKISSDYIVAKGDLFRYLVLYNEGGVYLDVKSTIIKPLEEILKFDDSYILSHWMNRPGDIHEYMGWHNAISNQNGEYQQWHVISCKGHPFLKLVIETVCSNIIQYNPFFHDVGRFGVVNLTGPIPYTLAIDSIKSLHPHRLVTNSDFGLVYSIYETAGRKIDYHASINEHHYSNKKTPVVSQNALRTILFNIGYPIIVFLKKSFTKNSNQVS